MITVSTSAKLLALIAVLSHILEHPCDFAVLSDRFPDIVRLFILLRVNQVFRDTTALIRGLLARCRPHV